ncbi:MAG TPA: OmpH family outer membrane protein [Rhodanobacteraceae bacterium]|nr:OmpH family outer membrane protein [Rhodanobacteraceae bacterium]
MRAAWRQPLAALLACMLAAAASSTPAQQPATRIGYVDMKRLLDQAPQVLQARQRLQREFASRDASLGKDETRLEALKADLTASRAQLSASEITQRQQAIDVLAGSVRRARERMQAELKDRSAQELDKSWQTISNAAVEYARSHHFDLVLPSPVIYASPRIDITDAVLAELRKQATGSTPP